MSEMKSWNCPHCGGTIVPDENGKPVTKCPFCDSLLELDTRSTEQKAYEAFKGKYKAEAEYNDAERRARQEYEREQAKQAEKSARSRRVKGRVIGCLTPVLILIILIAVGTIIVKVVDAKLTDPSSYIDVSFEGLDGSGHIVYTYHDDAPFDSYDVTTHCYEDNRLHNGQSVKIEFNPVDEKAMIKSVTKAYTVSGLKGVEKDLENFTADVMADIETKSKDKLKGAQGLTDERYQSMKRRCIYLRYDPDTNENVVWDVYQVPITSRGEDFGDRYVSVYYENLVIKSNGDLVYDGSGKGGHLMFFNYGEGFNGYDSFDDFLSVVKNNKINDPQYDQHDF